MRKKFSFFLAMCILLFSSVAMADYPEYLGGDKNYVLFDGIQGLGRYFDKKTLNVEKYAPPSYIIAIDYVSVKDADRGNTKISDRRRIRFAYDWNSKRIYSIGNDGSWNFLDPDGSRADGCYFALGADLVFQMAYNMKFYNN